MDRITAALKHLRINKETRRPVVQCLYLSYWISLGCLFTFKLALCLVFTSLDVLCVHPSVAVSTKSISYLLYAKPKTPSAGNVLCRRRFFFPIEIANCSSNEIRNQFLVMLFFSAHTKETPPLHISASASCRHFIRTLLPVYEPTFDLWPFTLTVSQIISSLHSPLVP